jgi:hypothetical protein
MLIKAVLTLALGKDYSPLIHSLKPRVNCTEERE